MKLDNNIKKELSTIAPLLAEIKRKNEDAVSEAFFTNLNSKVISAIRQEEKQAELKAFAPILAAIKKQDTKKLDESYFENLQTNIWRTIQQIENNTNRKPTIVESNVWDWILDLFYKPSFALSMSTVVAFVFGLMFFFSYENRSDIDSTIASANQLSTDEIEHYINEHNDEFDEAVLLKDVDIDVSILENSCLNESELNAYYKNEFETGKI